MTELRHTPYRNAVLPVTKKKADEIFSIINADKHSESPSRWVQVQQMNVGETIKSKCYDVNHTGDQKRCRVQVGWQSVQTQSRYEKNKNCDHKRGSCRYSYTVRLQTVCYKGWVYIKLLERNGSGIGMEVE